MSLEEPEALQVRLKGLNLRDLLNENFLQYLNDELNDNKVISIEMASGSDKKDRDIITIQHPTEKYEKENIVIIDVNKPETLKKIIEVIKKVNL